LLQHSFEKAKMVSGSRSLRSSKKIPPRPRVSSRCLKAKETKEARGREKVTKEARGREKERQEGTQEERREKREERRQKRRRKRGKEGTQTRGERGSEQEGEGEEEGKRESEEGRGRGWEGEEKGDKMSKASITARCTFDSVRCIKRIEYAFIWYGVAKTHRMPYL